MRTSQPIEKTVVVYVTAKLTKDRLTKKDDLNFESMAQPDESFPTIMIDPSKAFQTIVGFGGALTDAAAETFYRLPKEKQDEIISAYFIADKGIGYRLCRTSINSCDFSSKSYAYSEVARDTLLNNFSVGMDLKYRIPLIKEAMKATGNRMLLFASPWSPPAWMKTNNNMLNGGKIKPEYKNAWASYYVRFMQEYKKEGVSIWGITVQNEPQSAQKWESCEYTAEEERDFVKKYLGPTIEKSEFSKTKIIAWDHNRGLIYQRAKVMYDDPESEKHIWGLGFHWYTGDHFDNVALVHDAFPEKNLLFTEGCLYPFDSGKLNEWHWGEQYGESLIHDLNNWAVGWVDWNILLDENGGPNHSNNFCYAPIIGNIKTGELQFMNSYYYIGHFSKFIQPGAKRIACSSNEDSLIATAFVNQEGTIPVVVMNKTIHEIHFQVWISGKVCKYKALPNSIMTFIVS